MSTFKIHIERPVVRANGLHPRKDSDATSTHKDATPQTIQKLRQHNRVWDQIYAHEKKLKFILSSCRSRSMPLLTRARVVAVVFSILPFFNFIKYGFSDSAFSVNSKRVKYPFTLMTLLSLLYCICLVFMTGFTITISVLALLALSSGEELSHLYNRRIVSLHYYLSALEAILKAQAENAALLLSRYVDMLLVSLESHVCASSSGEPYDANMAALFPPQKTVPQRNTGLTHHDLGDTINKQIMGVATRQASVVLVEFDKEGWLLVPSSAQERW